MNVLFRALILLEDVCVKHLCTTVLFFWVLIVYILCKPWLCWLRLASWLDPFLRQEDHWWWGVIFAAGPQSGESVRGLFFWYWPYEMFPMRNPASRVNVILAHSMFQINWNYFLKRRGRSYRRPNPFQMELLQQTCSCCGTLPMMRVVRRSMRVIEKLWLVTGGPVLSRFFSVSKQLTDAQ